MKYLVLAIFLIAGPSQAQELQFDDTYTDDCLFEHVMGDFDHCIGLSAEHCLEHNDLGYSTAGQVMCYGAEAEWWDARLNVAYKALMAQSSRIDSENGESAPSQVAALRNMQRAWILFRDSKCDFERSQWGGGTGGGPAQVVCLMWATAEQTLFLEGRLSN